MEGVGHFFDVVGVQEPVARHAAQAPDPHDDEHRQGQAARDYDVPQVERQEAVRFGSDYQNHQE